MTAYYSNLAIEKRRNIVHRYLDWRQLYPFQVTAEPSAELGLVVVIPCFDEPDVGKTLASLAQCNPPGCNVEILVVVNSPEGASPSVLENNELASQQVTDAGRGSPGWLGYHGLRHDELPARHAGVGLARKIGMDESAMRIAQSRHCDGAIVSLDADCEVAPDFLDQVRREFVAHERCPGMSIYFEHPIPAEETAGIRDAIIDYELHLRYYVLGQRIARFPFAFHTVGSAMACRAASYAEQCGMNRRQGGEDFYFIQKLIMSGGYRALNSTTVYPGVRISDRVPFGTGPALADAVSGYQEMMTFAPEIFHDLECFCEIVANGSPGTFESECHALPAPLLDFFEEQEFATRLTEIKRNVAGPETFRKRVFRWLNAFRFLKFAQFASREYYPRVPVSRAAARLAESTGLAAKSELRDSCALLRTYRRLDKRAVTHEIVEDFF